MPGPIDEWPLWRRLPYQFVAAFAAVGALPGAALFVSLLMVLPLIVIVAAGIWALVFAGWTIGVVWSFLLTYVLPWVVSLMILGAPVFLVGRLVWRRWHQPSN
jgi:hypothetical protein